MDTAKFRAELERPKIIDNDIKIDRDIKTDSEIKSDCIEQRNGEDKPDSNVKTDSKEKIDEEENHDKEKYVNKENQENGYNVSCDLLKNNLKENQPFGENSPGVQRSAYEDKKKEYVDPDLNNLENGTSDTGTGPTDSLQGVPVDRGWAWVTLAGRDIPSSNSLSFTSFSKLQTWHV